MKEWSLVKLKHKAGFDPCTLKKNKIKMRTHTIGHIFNEYTVNTDSGL